MVVESRAIAATEIKMRKLLLQAMLEIISTGQLVRNFKKLEKALGDVIHERQQEVERLLERNIYKENLAKYICNNMQTRDNWSEAVRHAEEIIRMMR